jgi:beta-N-acetylhexosaminidase
MESDAPLTPPDKRAIFSKEQTHKHAIITDDLSLQKEQHKDHIAAIPTQQVPATPSNFSMSAPTPRQRQQGGLTRKMAALLMLILAMFLLQSLTIGPTQFLGTQGWSFVLYGSQATSADTRALNDLLHHRTTTTTTGKPSQSAANVQAYINLIVNHLSLDQKLGQMMMVQFVGSQESLDLSTMLSQYYVGSVILLTANGNVVDKAQLKELTQQMQQNSQSIPLTIAIDQEGGNVDRLVNLDGVRPSAASIGTTNDPQQAKNAGQQDAQDLASYGINLNLAPVVDVDNLSTSEMHTDDRTFGDNADIVTHMAGAYLQGLQQSGKVMGTLKHFPGLGDAAVDPHYGIPSIPRTQQQLESIDWSPYRALIKQNLVHAIMVTHEIIPSIDSSEPSSLSPKIVQGILRDEMKYNGVIITDSLTMEAITANYTPAIAAARAIEAGSDIIMGAGSPDEVATMIEGIKQAISSGSISQSRIDESVRRILLLKYQMGLLSLPH